MPCKYKLTYFNLRGRAELTRLLFAQAGVEYDDNRIPREDWPSLKENTPLGQLPVLEVDGEPVAQSMAIARYVAREHGLIGKTSWETAHIDMLVETFHDMTFGPLRDMIYCKDEKEKEEMKKKFQDQTLPTALGHINKLFCKNNDGNNYLVGDEVTMADIAFMNSMTWVLSVVPTGVDKFPKLKALNERVAALPKIAEWLEKRPVTDI